MEIADIKFKGGYIRGMNIHVDTDPEEVKFYLDPKHNAMCIEIINLSAFIGIDKVYFKMAGFKLDAKVDYDIKNGFSMTECI
jgi:hypothetical protein